MLLRQRSCVKAQRNPVSWWVMVAILKFSLHKITEHKLAYQGCFICEVIFCSGGPRVCALWGNSSICHPHPQPGSNCGDVTVSLQLFHRQRVFGASPSFLLPLKKLTIPSPLKKKKWLQAAPGSLNTWRNLVPLQACSSVKFLQQAEEPSAIVLPVSEGCALLVAV